MAGHQITVLVVDDSMFFRTAIANGLSKHPNIKVVGTAASAYEARDKILQLNPDVLTLDVEMPKMSGIDFLKILMPQRPMPVIVVSAVDGIVFDAMRYGAVDFVEKPSSGAAKMDEFTKDLAAKVMVASKAHLKTKAIANAVPKPSIITATKGVSNTSGLIAIGASTGGTEAIRTVIKDLPTRLPGIVVTQHMPPSFTNMYAQRLDRECALSVKEAADGDVVQPGHVYIAAGDKHMRVIKRGMQYTLRCAPGEKVSGHCPSVDVMFDSVAQFADANVVAVILTGMGADGAKGMVALKQKGAFTIGQDEKSCVVYGMPMMAFKMGGVTKQCSLENIPNMMLNYLAKR